MLINSDKLSVAYDHNDEVFGHAMRKVVDRNTRKVVLSESMKPILVKTVADKYRLEQFPIGKCLQTIQKHYVGFSTGLIRAQLVAYLNQGTGMDTDPGDAHVEGDVSMEMSPMIGVGMMPVQVVHKRQKSVNIDSLLIPDDEYVSMALILAKQMQLGDIECVTIRLAILGRLNKLKDANLTAVHWEEGDEYLEGGWRIIENNAGRVIPRQSELALIWEKMKQQTCNSVALSELSAKLSKSYTGINCHRTCLKTPLTSKVRPQTRMPSRIVFPPKPKTLGAHPMQYTQIDIVEMDDSDYGDRCYNKMLVVTDLFSRYLFGRALSDRTDQSLIVRHLMDIFGAFGPPEGYRSFTNGKTVAVCLEDVEKLFKISIKYIGNANMAHYHLRRIMYKKAENELGGRERWVEALPFAIIDVNQKPHRIFDYKLTPFEVMFGRRPWNAQNGPPPWLEMDDEYAEGDDGVEEQDDGMVEGAGERGDLEQWVGPFDITGATTELNKLRNLNKADERARKWHCRCPNKLCTRLFNGNCEHKLSQQCCFIYKSSCTFHRQNHLIRQNEAVYDGTGRMIEGKRTEQQEFNEEIVVDKLESVKECYRQQVAAKELAKSRQNRASFPHEKNAETMKLLTSFNKSAMSTRSAITKVADPEKRRQFRERLADLEQKKSAEGHLEGQGLNGSPSIKRGRGRPPKVKVANIGSKSPVRLLTIDDSSRWVAQEADGEHEDGSTMKRSKYVILDRTPSFVPIPIEVDLIKSPITVNAGSRLISQQLDRKNDVKRESLINSRSMLAELTDEEKKARLEISRLLDEQKKGREEAINEEMK